MGEIIDPSKHCSHDYVERETACAYGMCPHCLEAEIESLRAQLAEANEELSRLRPSHGLLAVFNKKLEQAYEDLQREVEELREAVQRSVLAINDWLHQYAPEEFDEDDVARTRSRIHNNGGTLAYIAQVQEQNRTALAKSKDKPHA